MIVTITISITEAGGKRNEVAPPPISYYMSPDPSDDNIARITIGSSPEWRLISYVDVIYNDSNGEKKTYKLNKKILWTTFLKNQVKGQRIIRKIVRRYTNTTLDNKEIMTQTKREKLEAIKKLLQDGPTPRPILKLGWIKKDCSELFTQALNRYSNYPIPTEKHEEVIKRKAGLYTQAWANAKYSYSIALQIIDVKHCVPPVEHDSTRPPIKLNDIPAGDVYRLREEAEDDVRKSFYITYDSLIDVYTILHKEISFNDFVSDDPSDANGKVSKINKYQKGILDSITNLIRFYEEIREVAYNDEILDGLKRGECNFKINMAEGNLRHEFKEYAKMVYQVNVFSEPDKQPPHCKPINEEKEYLKSVKEKLSHYANVRKGLATELQFYSYEQLPSYRQILFTGNRLIKAIGYLVKELDKQSHLNEEGLAIQPLCKEILHLEKMVYELWNEYKQDSKRQNKEILHFHRVKDILYLDSFETPYKRKLQAADLIAAYSVLIQDLKEPNEFTSASTDPGDACFIINRDGQRIIDKCKKLIKLYTLIQDSIMLSATEIGVLERSIEKAVVKYRGNTNTSLISWRALRRWGPNYAG